MKGKFTILLMLTCLFYSHVFSQGVLTEWVYNIGDNDEQEVREVYTDHIGNVYVAGRFKGTVDFDLGPGVTSLTSNGGYDAFVMKLTPNGSLLWAKNFGGIYNDWIDAIAVDSLGDVYTTGVFRNTVDFDPGAGVDSYSNTLYAPFIHKLNSDGTYEWVKVLETTGSNNNPSTGEDITIDNNYNVVVVGKFWNTMDVNTGSGTDLVTPNGNSDVFVIKHDSAGNFNWTKTFGGNNSDEGVSVTITPDNDIVTSGTYADNVDFDPGVNTDIYQSSFACFIHKMDENGNYLWVKSYGDVAAGVSKSTIDNDGNIYTTGYLGGTTDFDPGIGVENLTQDNLGFYVLKLTENGDFTWANDYGDYQYAVSLDLDLDTAGNILLTGVFNDSLAMGNDIYEESAFSTVSFISKLSNDGTATWVKALSSSSNSNNRSVAVSTYGDKIYCGGYFEGTTDFDVSMNTQDISVVDTRDLFVLKLETCLYGTSIDVQNTCGPFTWIDGNTYSSSNNTATYLIPGGAASGCDSLVTLDLTVNEVDSTVSATTYQLTSNQVGAIYQWLDCDNNLQPISGATSQTFSPQNNGNYAVEVTVNGCADTSACFAVTTVGINNENAENILIYPNPTTNNFIIEVENLNQPFYAEIFDVLGKNVKNVNLTNTKSNISMEAYPSGVYFIKIGQQTYKLIKE